MFIKRKNDPLGVSASGPSIVTDAGRVAELTAEVKRKLAFIRWHYQLAIELFDDGPSFNESLRALKYWYANSQQTVSRPHLHPELGFAAWCLSRHTIEAEFSPNRVACATFEEGVREAVRCLKPRRGRPKDVQLRQHVEGLMALIQEAAGLPVHATRYKNNEYAPQASDALSNLVVYFFRQIDPKLTETRIVNIMLDARQRHRGAAMRFCDYFPSYGARVTLHVQ